MVRKCRALVLFTCATVLAAVMALSTGSVALAATRPVNVFPGSGATVPLTASNGMWFCDFRWNLVSGEGYRTIGVELYVYDANGDLHSSQAFLGPVTSFKSTQYGLPAGSYYWFVRQDCELGTVVDSYATAFTVPNLPPPPPTAVGTVLTLSAPASCARGASIQLTGTLKTAAGVPLAGKQVWIDAGTPIIGSEGCTWETLLNPLTTDASGAFSTTVQPIKSLYLRARFDAQTGYNGTTSLVKTVTVVLPAAAVYTPHAPTSARHGKSYTVWGYLKPQHAAGSFAIKLYCYRLQKGKYVLRKTVSVRVSNYSTYSKYSGKVSLPYTGKWRIKAGHSDDDHRASYSGYDYVRSY